MTSMDADPCTPAALRDVERSGWVGQSSGFRGTATWAAAALLQKGRELWVGQELAVAAAGHWALGHRISSRPWPSKSSSLPL
jgi:hypothetical protein